MTRDERSLPITAAIQGDSELRTGWIAEGFDTEAVAILLVGVCFRRPWSGHVGHKLAEQPGLGQHRFRAHAPHRHL